MKHSKRDPAVGEFVQMTQFEAGHKLRNPYDWLKLPYAAIVRLIPSFRDALFVVGKK
jgi:hypothetical protein